MMEKFDFENLKVYQKSIDLTNEIFLLSRKFSKDVMRSQK